MNVVITTEPFNPWTYLQNHEQTFILNHNKIGATATFVGTVRDLNQDAKIHSLFLEHYPGMTEKYLYSLSEPAHQQWDIVESLIVHRVGTLYPGETIVLIAVWATHRQPALAACQFLLEALKAKAPFWKRERLVGKEHRWVSKTG